MDSLLNKIEDEYQGFKESLIHESTNLVWEKCHQIYFYSSIHEYFMYNRDIPKEIMYALDEKQNIIAECWQMYLSKEELSVYTWQNITDILELCVAERKGVESMETFKIKVCEMIRQGYPGVLVRTDMIVKNNGTKLNAITISEPGNRLSPIIYLEPFYEDYISGTTLAETVAQIMRVYERNRCDVDVQMEELLDWEKVQDKIACKFINRERNEEFLKDAPYIEWCDLAIVFYVVLKHGENGNATIIVNNKLLSNWEKSIEELMRVAGINTPKMFPAICKSMKEMVEDLLEIGELPDICDEKDIRIISNGNTSLGAITILYPGVLASLAEELQSDLYILPSSTHECLVLTIEDNDMTELMKMVREVNATAVSEQDYLSDSVYHYDRQRDVIHMYSKDMEESEVEVGGWFKGIYKRKICKQG